MHKCLKKNNVSKMIVAVLIAVLLTGTLSGCGKTVVKSTTETAKIDYLDGISENTIEVSSDGSIIEVSVEDFSDASVTDSDVKKYINDKITEFNQKEGADKVSLLEFSMNGSTAKCAVKYLDVSSYSKFDNTYFSLSLYNVASANDAAIEEAASVNDAAEKKAEAVANAAKKSGEVSESELAEAGYSAEDLKNGELASASDPVKATDLTQVKATFTDASGNENITSDKISADNNMMIITSVDSDISFIDGTVLYTNKHAEVLDSGKVHTDGSGKAVIIFKFQY